VTPADSTAALDAVFDRDLLPALHELEAERRSVVRQGLVEGGITLAVAGLAWFLASNISPLIAIGVTVLAIIWFGVRCYLRNDAYTAAFKSRIIAKLVALVDPHLQYDPGGVVTQEAFEASGLFTQTPDSYRGGDKVAGTLGATEMVFSEVDAQYRTTSTDSKGHTTTHWHSIFHGVFFIADFNKSFRGRTFVLPDTAERLFGVVGQMLQSWNASRPDLIKLEDPEFEKVFVVYADDQIEARYILSPGLMRRILDYRAMTGADIRLSFVNSRVFVAIPESGDLFEPRLFSTILDAALIKQYLACLQLVTGIVHEFNLNTRIWGKS
jgi:uncharacterized protein DUF3137